MEEPIVEGMNATGRRRNLGRSSRRRVRKAKELEAAYRSLVSNDGTPATPASAPQQTLPMDRSETWMGCQLCRQVTAEDESALIKQLGYLPGNVVAIACRSGDLKLNLGTESSEPVVLQLYPIAVRHETQGRRGGKPTKARTRRLAAGDNSSSLIEPFPTTYWLTHPGLHCLVSKLELEGYGPLFEERLSNCPESQASMDLAHELCAAERWGFLSEADQTLIQERSWERAFASGIAGMRNSKAIKCLHAHTAHYLSKGKGSEHNVVGKWTMDTVEERWGSVFSVNEPKG